MESTLHLTVFETMRTGQLQCVIVIDHVLEQVFFSGFLLQMQFDNDSFSVVLDKGTLDAIFTEKSELIVKDVHKMFSEIHRVLKPGGRYICITLVQEHILDELLAYFPSNWFMRIHRAEKQEDDDSGSSGLGGKLPVFIFVMTKMKIACEYTFLTPPGQLMDKHCT